MSSDISFSSKSSPSTFLKEESDKEIEMLMGDLIIFSPAQPMLAPIDHKLENELEIENFQL